MLDAPPIFVNFQDFTADFDPVICDYSWEYTVVSSEPAVIATMLTNLVVITLDETMTEETEAEISVIGSLVHVTGRVEAQTTAFFVIAASVQPVLPNTNSAPYIVPKPTDLEVPFA